MRRAPARAAHHQGRGARSNHHGGGLDVAGGNGGEDRGIDDAQGFDAAHPRNLGATRTQAFLQVTAPQIGFALVTSAVLSFLTSFDEVAVALFVSGGDNATLTRRMFLALRDQIDPTIAAISTIMIVMTSLLLAVSQLFCKSES